MRLFWPSLQVLHRRTLTPFRHRLGVDTTPLAQLSERSMGSNKYSLNLYVQTENRFTSAGISINPDNSREGGGGSVTV